MISADEIALVCERLGTRSERGSWYRAVRPQYLAEALNVEHTSKGMGRFHRAGTCTILYLVGSPDASLYEVEYITGRPGVPGGSIPNPRAGAFTILTVEASLARVIDLTDADTREAFRTTAQELTGDWRGYWQRDASTRLQEPTGPAPTQNLGGALFACGRFEGFVSFSAQVPYEPILCVFPDRLQRGAYVEYSWTDSAGLEQKRRIGATKRTLTRVR